MPNLRIPASFCKSLSSCCTALLSALLLTALIACTGNGGAANSNGEVYIPGGSSGGVTLVTPVQLHRAAAAQKPLPHRTCWTPPTQATSTESYTW